MTDIPLEKATLVWNSFKDGSEPTVKVVGGVIPDDREYSRSRGACDSDFNEASAEGKLHILLCEVQNLTVNDKVPPADVHNELMKVPEYRHALRERGVIPPEEDAEY